MALPGRHWRDSISDPSKGAPAPDQSSRRNRACSPFPMRPGRPTRTRCPARTQPRCDCHATAAKPGMNGASSRPIPNERSSIGINASPSIRKRASWSSCSGRTTGRPAPISTTISPGTPASILPGPGPVQLGGPGSIASRWHWEGTAWPRFILSVRRPAGSSSVSVTISVAPGDAAPPLRIYDPACLAGKHWSASFEEFWQSMMTWPFGHPRAVLTPEGDILAAWYAGSDDVIGMRWARVSV